MNRIRKGIKKLSNSDNRLHSLENTQKKLVLVHTALQNIADAIASGLISESLTAKLNELELQKMALEQQLRDFDKTATVADTVNIRLKTGLDIFPELDNTYSVRREEIYVKGKSLA